MSSKARGKGKNALGVVAIRSGANAYYNIAQSEPVQKTVVFTRDDFESALKKVASAKPSKSAKP
jgi:hypothetical protein